MAATGTAQTLVNILTSPGEAFSAIEARRHFLVPMLLLLVASGITAGLYLAEVDVGWLTERSLRSIPFVDLSDEQITEIADQAASAGRTAVMVQGVINAVGGVLIFLLLQATYLKIVTLFMRDRVSFRHWFSLICFTAIPGLFGTAATAVFILTNDVSFIDQTGINPLSFGNLAQADLSEANLTVRILMSLGPLNVWTLILLILGYRALAHKGLAFSTVVLIAPLVFLGAIGVALA